MTVKRFGAVLLGAAVLLVVPAGPVPAVTHHDTAAPRAAAAMATQCTAADLKAAKGTLHGNVGSRILDVFVTNISDHTCQTGGFTLYRFRNSTGLIGWQSIGNPVMDGATPVVLAPNGKAKSVLMWTDPAFAAGECRARHASGVRLRINDVDKSYILRLDLRVCTTKRFRPQATRLSPW